MITEEIRVERQNYIGGSDIGIILGLSNFKTPYQLFLEKKGVFIQNTEESPNQYWGNLLEPTIRKEFEKKNFVSIEYPIDTKQHTLYPFLKGNLDGFIPEWNSVFEVKTASSFMKDKWGEPGTDQIPQDYLVQVAFYCALTNADFAHIAVLIGGSDYREYKYTRNHNLEENIIKAACEFWNNLQTDIPPLPINIDDLKLRWPNSTPHKVKIISEDIIYHDLHCFKNTKERQKELSTIEDSYKFRLMEYMQDSEVLHDNQGKVLATWKTNKIGVRVFNLKENKD
jgi:putative phage-type endonuclease